MDRVDKLLALSHERETRRVVNPLVPFFFDLRGRRFVIVGAGRVAERRTRALLPSGAELIVVAPLGTDTFREWALEGSVEWRQRAFEPADLDGATFALIAVNSPAVAAAARDAARARAVLVCDAGDGTKCDYQFPAIAEHGDIRVAVSTSGKSPALAAAVRDQVSDLLSTSPLAESLDSLPDRRSARRVAGPSNAGSRRAGSVANPIRPRISIVGAGPGDPGLLTLRGRERIDEADVVFFDRLVGAAILDLVPPHAEKVYVGKEVGDDERPDIGALLVAAYRAGRRAVRLKGGDPGIFGRVGEELIALHRAGVEFEVVAGVSSLSAVPLAAGIPVTYRDVAQELVVRTGHLASPPASSGTDANPSSASMRPGVERRARGPDRTTWVYFMAVASLDAIVAELLAEGASMATPVAVIERGTRPDQKVLLAELGNVAEQASGRRIAPPALIVVGDVVRFADLDAFCRSLEPSSGAVPVDSLDSHLAPAARRFEAP
jgi:uroporphyrin-III C-methyltransferase/precorrin-2 dehydrogenase/sirohydrochlorin ferrochelatase